MTWEKKLITYVKDEGSNLNIMTTDLKFVVSCDILGLVESFQSSCFGHAFFKVCNMFQLMKKFVRVWNMYLSKLPNLTYKDA